MSIEGLWVNAGAHNNIGNTSNYETFVNQSGATLNNAGNIYDSGEFLNDGIINNETGGLLRNESGSLTNTGILNNNGTLINDDTLNNDSTINNDGAISNTGDFDVANTGTVTGNGTFTQTTGSTIVDGSLTQGSITFAGGALGGQGIVTSSGAPVDIDPGAIINPGGTISSSPSDFTGMLTFGSDVDFDGAMTFELAGLADFDTIDILGSIDFGLNSQINFDLEGYLPSAGDSLVFLFSDALKGFDNIAYNFLDPLPGLNFDVFLTPDNDLRLEFSEVPVPAAVWLFASGLIGMASVARKRRTA
jgi:hypothetical protein